MTPKNARSVIDEIVRIGDDVDATINQGTGAGLVLGGGNVLSTLAILDKSVEPMLVVTCVVVVVVSQLVLAAVTWMRLKPMWARRRILCEELRTGVNNDF